MSGFFTRAHAEELWLAALYSAERLAVELERLGLAHPDRSLKDARQLRPVLLILGPDGLDVETLEKVAQEIQQERQEP